MSHQPEKHMLPLYKSHKLVRAAKVVDVITDVNSYDYSFKLDTGDVVPPPKGKHDANPVGGYYVEYADGYTSWSPAKAFEEGHTRVEA